MWLPKKKKKMGARSREPGMYIMDYRRLRMMALPINQNEIPHNLLLTVDCYIDWMGLVQDQIRILKSMSSMNSFCRDVRHEANYKFIYGRLLYLSRLFRLRSGWFRDSGQDVSRYRVMLARVAKQEIYQRYA